MQLILSIYHVICSVTSKINIKIQQNLIFVQLAVSHMTLLVNSIYHKMAISWNAVIS